MRSFLPRWSRPGWELARRSRRFLGRPAARALPILGLVLLLHGIWPYAALWSLDRALARRDQATLAALVDLEAVRDEIARRLNKDRVSVIEGVSDPFIAWLETGIRQHGDEALQSLVTLEWVGDQFGAVAPSRLGLLASISEVFFEGFGDVRVRVDRPSADPLNLRLQFRRLGWRLTMVSY
ncbi:DUF2939 domain-containing protein [Thiocystis violacea]|uniref:DUF2939 domain-containing protein n=1 Tax=Thiocystis violacea TaxID=13725 RepID=UPI0019073792|nr:DUF2939 domain-containing protein [Thiocystis violacea]MBK1716579.1 hypothetical protein [Thiocystis violacea]